MIQKLRLAIRNDLEAPAEARQFGSGWISGVLALVFSIAGLLLLLSQRYPALFSVKELGALHQSSSFSVGLQAVLVAAFAMACANLVLRRNKTLGFVSIFLVLATATLGAVERAHASSATVSSLGLDWFVLNLLLTGFLYLPLEKLFGRLTEQPLFRIEWREDLFYFLVGSLFVQSLTYLTLVPSRTILHHTTGWEGFRQTVSGLPLLVQFLTIMLLTDFVQYWFHRFFHQVPFLWRFHAVHHSARQMDWLAGSRMHLVEILALRSATLIPMAVLGFHSDALHLYILWVYLNATYLHANLRFDVEWIKPWVATARFHHWHHGIEPEAIDVNFAIHFSWLDRLFGTYHCPKGRWPSGYGIGGHPVPRGYWKQFLYPFRDEAK